MTDKQIRDEIDSLYSYKYFLKGSWENDYKEVTKQEWIKAERSAGFRPKMSSTDPDYMNVCATGGFFDGNVDGKIEMIKK